MNNTQLNDLEQRLHSVYLLLSEDGKNRVFITPPIQLAVAAIRDLRAEIETLKAQCAELIANTERAKWRVESGELLTRAERAETDAAYLRVLLQRWHNWFQGVSFDPIELDAVDADTVRALENENE